MSGKTMIIRIMFLLFVAAASFEAGYNDAMNKTFGGILFGEATVKEIYQAGLEWKK